LIIERDDIQECCQWFRKRETAEVFTTNKLVQAMEMDIQIIRVNEKTVADMQNFLRAKVVQ